MRKLTLSLAVMAALMPVRGYPLGLGEIELHSALNQELNAEIEVLSTVPEEAEQLIVKLADREAFNRAGIDRPFLLQQLKFKVIQKGGESLIKVYTTSPIREPYLNFLLEIDWPKGHLLREYTLLLDPPVYNTGVTSAPVTSAPSHPYMEPAEVQEPMQPDYAPSVSPVAPPQPAEEMPYQEEQQAQMAPDTDSQSELAREMAREEQQQAMAQAEPAPAPAPVPAPAPAGSEYQPRPVPQAVAAPEQYRIQKNDTLWSIANRTRPDQSVTVQQMMLALLKKNPEAFIKDNINGIKRGYILRMPTRDEVMSVDRQQALAEAREHASLWRQYQQATTSATPASSLEAESAQGGASGKTQAAGSDGKLSILGASDAEASEFAGSNQDPDAEVTRLRQELDLAREQLESSELEKADLKSRLNELESRVQRVIEMGDDELAKLQQDMQGGAESTEAAPAEQPAETQEAPEEPAAAEEAAAEVPAEEMPAEAVEPGAEPAAPAEESLFADEGEKAADQAQTAAEMPAEKPQAIQPAKPPAFAQKQPKGLVDSLMDDPKLLAMIGGGLAFILMLVALLVRRMRAGKADEPQEWDSILSDELSEISPLDATVEAPVEDLNDTTQIMSAPPLEEAPSVSMDDTQIEAPVEDTVFDMQAQQPEEQEQDDVLSEADVYLSYGIYEQAEELLKSAIEQNPGRDDYRMKLLETYFAAKNESAFEQLAQDVQSRKGSDQAYWGRVAAMGVELCPASSLFAGGSAMAAAGAALIPEKPETTDFELDAGSSADDMDLGDLDLGLDEFDTPASEPAPVEMETDFSADLDLGEPETDDAELDLGDDFSLDFEASDLGLEEASEEPASSGELDLGDDLDLGMDLDLGAEEEPLVSDDNSLDMDMDLGDFGLEEETSPATESDELDLDMGDLGLDLEETAEAPEESGGLEFDLGEDLGLDLDLEEESSSDDLDLSLDDDTSGDDLGFDLDEDTSGGELDLGLDEDFSLDTDETDMDMGGLSLDTDESDDFSGGLDFADDGDFDLSELSEDIDEVSTKLDLAKAYIDMGDNEGARSILEEVKAEGNNEQQQKADELLRQAS